MFKKQKPIRQNSIEIAKIYRCAAEDHKRRTFQQIATAGKVKRFVLQQTLAFCCLNKCLEED